MVNRAPIIAIVLLALSGRTIGARADSIAEARERLGRMPPERREELRLRWEQFQQLPRETRQRLRHLHRELADDPRSDELRRVMHRYHAWLKTLPPLTRAELRGLPPDERIERIRQLRRDRDGAGLRHLDEPKADALSRWLMQRSERIIDRLPEPQRTRLRGLDDPRSRRMAVVMLWHWMSRSPGGRGRLIDDDALTELRATMPDEVGRAMERLAPDEQRDLVADWVRQIVRRHWNRGRNTDGDDPRFEERLAEFFEKELEEPEVDRLMQLPPDQMRAELLRLYLERHGPERNAGFGPPRGGFGPRGPGRNRGPGGGFRPGETFRPPGQPPPSGGRFDAVDPPPDRPPREPSGG